VEQHHSGHGGVGSPEPGPAAESPAARERPKQRAAAAEPPVGFNRADTPAGQPPAAAPPSRRPRQPQGQRAAHSGPSGNGEQGEGSGAPPPSGPPRQEHRTGRGPSGAAASALERVQAGFLRPKGARTHAGAISSYDQSARDPGTAPPDPTQPGPPGHGAPQAATGTRRRPARHAEGATKAPAASGGRRARGPQPTSKEARPRQPHRATRERGSQRVTRGRQATPEDGAKRATAQRSGGAQWRLGGDPWATAQGHLAAEGTAPGDSARRARAEAGGAQPGAARPQEGERERREARGQPPGRSRASRSGTHGPARAAPRPRPQDRPGAAAAQHHRARGTRGLRRPPPNPPRGARPARRERPHEDETPQERSERGPGGRGERRPVPGSTATAGARPSGPSARRRAAPSRAAETPPGSGTATAAPGSPPQASQPRGPAAQPQTTGQRAPGDPLCRTPTAERRRTTPRHRPGSNDGHGREGQPRSAPRQQPGPTQPGASGTDAAPGASTRTTGRSERAGEHSNRAHRREANRPQSGGRAAGATARRQKNERTPAQADKTKPPARRATAGSGQREGKATGRARPQARPGGRPAGNGKAAGRAPGGSGAQRQARQEVSRTRGGRRGRPGGAWAQPSKQEQGQEYYSRSRAGGRGRGKSAGGRRPRIGALQSAARLPCEGTTGLSRAEGAAEQPEGGGRRAKPAHQCRKALRRAEGGALRRARPASRPSKAFSPEVANQARRARDRNGHDSAGARPKKHRHRQQVPSAGQRRAEEETATSTPAGAATASCQEPERAEERASRAKPKHQHPEKRERQEPKKTGKIGGRKARAATAGPHRRAGRSAGQEQGGAGQGGDGAPERKRPVQGEANGRRAGQAAAARAAQLAGRNGPPAARRPAGGRTPPRHQPHSADPARRPSSGRAPPPTTAGAGAGAESPTRGGHSGGRRAVGPRPRHSTARELGAARGTGNNSSAAWCRPATPDASGRRPRSGRPPAVEEGDKRRPAPGAPRRNERRRARERGRLRSAPGAVARQRPGARPRGAEPRRQVRAEAMPLQPSARNGRVGQASTNILGTRQQAGGGGARAGRGQDGARAPAPGGGARRKQEPERLTRAGPRKRPNNSGATLRGRRREPGRRGNKNSGSRHAGRHRRRGGRGARPAGATSRQSATGQPSSEPLANGRGSKPGRTANGRRHGRDARAQRAQRPRDLRAEPPRADTRPALERNGGNPGAQPAGTASPRTRGAGGEGRRAPPGLGQSNNAWRGKKGRPERMTRRQAQPRRKRSFVSTSGRRRAPGQAARSAWSTAATARAVDQGNSTARPADPNAVSGSTGGRERESASRRQAKAQMGSSAGASQAGGPGADGACGAARRGGKQTQPRAPCVHEPRARGNRRQQLGSARGGACQRQRPINGVQRREHVRGRNNRGRRHGWSVAGRDAPGDCGRGARVRG